MESQPMTAAETVVPTAMDSEWVDAAKSLDAELLDPKSTELSTEFVGRWSQLISTTNWEKGKIIIEWRETLIDSESAAATYSDEAWSQRVGGVTPQHVGRLRRVFERFGASYASYPALFWSHFLAAMDWDDAELWLEGASQSGWSVSQMRRTRWEANGSDPDELPRVAEVASISDDEDYSPLAEVGDEPTGKGDGPRDVSEGPRYDEPDFGDESDVGASGSATTSDDDDLAWDDPTAQGTESPFAKLPSLPVDMAEALEQFKLAIIRHRASSWAEVSRGDVMLALDALKAFASQ